MEAADWKGARHWFWSLRFFEMGFLGTQTALELRMSYVAKDDLELLTLLPPPPECLGHWCACGLTDLLPQAGVGSQGLVDAASIPSNELHAQFSTVF